MRSRLGYTVGGLFVLILLVAYWAGVRPWVSIMRYSAIQGFCPLDKTNKVDSKYIDAMSKFASVGGFSLGAAYADCQELAEARKSGEFISTKIGIFPWLRGADSPSTQFVSDACDHLRKSGLSDEQKARVSQYVTEFSNSKSSMKSVLPLGVLDEVKGTVCYPAELMKGTVPNTGEVTLVHVSAMTTAGNHPVMIAQWTKFVDETSIASALASMKTIYSDFLAANGKAN